MFTWPMTRGSRRLARTLLHLAPLLAAACSDRAQDCRYTLTCGDSLTASGSSDAGPAGGTTANGSTAETNGSGGIGGGLSIGGTLGAGGASAVDGTGGVFATGGAPTCEPACEGATPICELSTLACVECTGHEHCTDKAATPFCASDKKICVECTGHEHCADKATRPYCDIEKNSCVECLDNEDCESAAASACVAGKCSPCKANNDCAHIDNYHVCKLAVDADAGAEFGTCVECTGTDYVACRESDAGPSFVCESLNNECSHDKTEHSAGLCQPCVSDAQCQSGALCVEQQFNGKSVGYFCLDRQTAAGPITDCTWSTNRPFVRPLNATSIDGTRGTVCSLAVSTCTALNQFRQVSCASTTNTPDDALCGFAPGADSRCVLYGTSQYRCTVTCWSEDDCLPGATCDKGAMPRVCSIQ